MSLPVLGHLLSQKAPTSPRRCLSGNIPLRPKQTRGASVKELRKSPPWITTYNELDGLFGADPDIMLTYDDEEHSVTMLVEGNDKADAISRILPSEYDFGNVVMKVNVVPSNTDSIEAMARRAFSGNPAVSHIETLDDGTPVFGGRTYVVFKPDVVQFYDDDMSDYNGLRTTLYQDIARRLMQVDGVSFCTDFAI